MDLVFNQQGNEWVAEFEATADFNLHIERAKSGYVEVYQRTAGEKYAHVKGVHMQLRYQLTIDETFVGVVWPKTMKVVCATEPSVAVVTSDGETTQIGGGNSMIEFSVNGTTYQAEEGMTWAEFVESEYNDGEFIYEEMYDSVSYQGNPVFGEDYRSVKGSAQINSGGTYTVEMVG